MITLNKSPLLLSLDEVNNFSLDDKIELLPYVNFEEDPNEVQKILQSPLFQSIFKYYQENYSNDMLRSKPLIEQQIGTYLYITGQDENQQAKIENMLYWRYLPTIEEFINDERYLGKLFKNTLYQYWKDAFSEIYSPESCINKVILAGSTGSGKSTAARIGLLYAMYRVLCLRNPQSVLGITQEAALSAFILSVNLKLAEKTNYSPFVAILDNAPCFKRTRNIDDFYTFGPEDPVPFMVSRSDLSVKFPNNLNFLIGSEASHIVSHNVVCSFSDEISEKSSPVEIEKTLDLLNAMDSRLQNRFMGSNYIIQYIASSAKTNRSALAEYIKNTPKTPAFKIYDPRAWEIKPDPAFIGDGTTFPVLVGNGVIQSRILDQPDEIEKANNGTFALENGCEILNVPVTYKPQFEMNLDRSLQDIAGIVTLESNLLIHDTSKLEDPLLPPELHVEANLGENVKIVDLLPQDMFESINGKTQLKRFPKAARYMHFDLAEAGGKSEAGVSMCHKEYYIDPTTLEKVPMYIFDFVMWINAKARIDLVAIRKFVYDLIKEKNVYIDSISTDQFQCFTGDTKIKLLDGRDLPIKEIVERIGNNEELYTYTYDIEHKKIVPGKIINGQCTGVKPIFKVTLDNGEVITCTKDHRFMLRDGTFCEAQYLQPNTALMPLYTSTNKKGYEITYNPLTGSDTPTYKRIAEYIYGSDTAYSHHIHHKDFNKHNNNPTNLIPLTKEEHLQLHMRHMKKLWEDPEWQDYMSTKTRLRHASMSPEEKKEFGRKCSEGNKKTRKEHPELWKNVGPATVEDFNKNNGQRRKEQAQRITTINKTIKPRKGSKTSEEARNTFSKANKKTWEKPGYKEKMKKRYLGSYSYLVNKFGKNYKELLTEDQLKKEKEQCYLLWLQAQPWYKNHKVISVEDMGYTEEVFDIQIDNFPNFALSAGVFVHNSTVIREEFELSGLFREVAKVSVDTTCAPYEYLAAQIESGHLKTGKCDYLKRQLHALKLQDGKVQRTTERKDMADSMCGSVELARRNYKDDPVTKGQEYLIDFWKPKEIKYEDVIPEGFSISEI